MLLPTVMPVLLTVIAEEKINGQFAFQLAASLPGIVCILDKILGWTAKLNEMKNHDTLSSHPDFLLAMSLKNRRKLFLKVRLQHYWEMRIESEILLLFLQPIETNHKILIQAGLN